MFRTQTVSSLMFTMLDLKWLTLLPLSGSEMGEIYL